MPRAEGAAAEPAPETGSTTARRGSLSVTVDDGECLAAEPIAERIVAEFPNATSAEVTVAVTEVDAGRVDVVMRAGAARAERELQFGDEPCDTRTTTVALSLALALEFFVATRDEELEPERRPNAEPRPNPPDPRPKRPEPDAPRNDRGRRGPGWSIAGGAVMHSGVVAHPTVGALLRAEHGWSRVAVRGAAQWTYADGVPLGAGRLRVQEVVAVPEGCARVDLARAALAACGGARIGAVIASGRGFARPRVETSVWITPSSSFEVVAPLGGRLALAVGAHVGVPLLRSRFVAGPSARRGAPVLGGATVALVVFLSDR